MDIAITSGKGGTGKTFISTNIAYALSKSGKSVTYLDCDVEEPNGHLFLKPVIEGEKDVVITAPGGVDEEKCVNCGKCVEACRYNAIARVKDKILFFKELCHVCGACQVVCPVDAVVEEERVIGVIKHGRSGNIPFHYALLQTAEGGMSPRLIKKVKENAGEGVNILDSPPGTACPVVETVREADLCVLVTDPTPFGINDLKLAVEMCRDIGKEPVVVVNRAEYFDDKLKKYCEEEELSIIGEIPDERKIAEIYSTGDLAAEKMPELLETFERIAGRMLELASRKREVKKVSARLAAGEEKKRCLEKAGKYRDPLGAGKPKELVVISGKGGTGKTSITGAFAALAENIIISDCDVDAADLHLLLEPEVFESGDFSGGVQVEIDARKCTGCGRCMEECRFSAVKKEFAGNDTVFRVDPVACEGCGVCYLVCRDDAVRIKDAVNGSWYLSDTRFGKMSHAKLGIAEENSGRLVTLVRNKAALLAKEAGLKEEIIDGSPGTGCPVIASLTGADHAVIVTEPTVSGIHDMERIFAVTKHFGISSGVVVNKYDLNTEMTERIRSLSAENGVEFLGLVPYDKKFTEAQMEGLSVVEYCGDCEVSKSIKDIWNKVSRYLCAASV